MTGLAAPVHGPRELHDVACVVHVHSTFSDGTSTPPEIMAAAREAGVDAVLLTDHDTLAARRAGWEGMHDGVMLLVGHEVSPPGGHLLAFGVDAEIDHRGRSEAEICAAVAAAGGLAIAAHPFSAGSRVSPRIGKPRPWTAIDACAGIELWSLLTDGAERLRGPRDLLRFVLTPERSVDGPPPEHLAAWDALCRTRRVPAIGGLDSHQTGVRLLGRSRSPVPHRRWFRLLQTYVQLERPLSGSPAADGHAVYGALAEGRCLLVRADLGSARGFRLWADGPDGALEMGTQAPAGEWTLHARLPRPAQLRLLRDGEPVAEARADALSHPARAPGAYRLEARVPAHGGTRTWIVSNPIYLRAAATGRGRL